MFRLENFDPKAKKACAVSIVCSVIQIPGRIRLEKERRQAKEKLLIKSNTAIAFPLHRGLNPRSTLLPKFELNQAS